MPLSDANDSFRQQINSAAFQFNTVDTIKVYLNNKLFNWCNVDMSDGEGGCSTEPMYWIDSK